MNETTKQNLAILAITLLLAGAIFIFFNYLSPAIQDSKQLKLSIKNTQDKIQLLQDYQSKAEALAKNYATQGDSISKINLALPDQPNTAQVLASLNAIAQTHKITIGSLSFQEGKEKDLSYLEVKTSFTTTYDNFKAWLEDVEKEIRLTDVRKVNIKLSSNILSSKKSHHRITSFPLDISLTLRSYYLSPLDLNKSKSSNNSK